MLERSRTCVFQGGIKMHDRNILICRHRIPTWVCIGWRLRWLRSHRGMSDQSAIRSYLAQSVLPILARDPFSPMLVVPVFPSWEYLMDVFRSSLVLVSRPVGRGEKDSSSIGLGECVAPDQI